MNTQPTGNRNDDAEEERGDGGNRPVVRGAFVNVNGLAARGECVKLREIVKMLDSGEERLDYVFIGETFHQQETALKGLSFFVGSSRRGRGGHRGGVALLARSALKERITSVRVGEDWVGFEFAGLRIGGAYLSPSLGPFEIGRRLKDLDGGRKLDLVYGDFNVDLGQIVGRSGFPRPVERVEEVLEWGTRWELEALTPLAGEAAKWDQVFRRRDLFANLWVTPKSQLPFKTDHPLLRVNHYAENGHTDAEEEKGAERYRISLLQHEEVLKRYRREFNRYGPELEALAKEVWEKAASASREEKKTLVDTLDLGILERINKAAKDSLGTYHASAIRNEPDTSAAHLVKSPHPSDALRLFKRSQRGRQPRVASEDPNKSPMAEAVEHYKSVFGSEAEVPELDEEEEEGEWEGGKRETDALLSTKKVVSVINRYGRHKSPGSDSIHVILLSALCPSNPQKSKKPPKKPTSRPDWTRTDPSLSPPPHFLIPTQPSMLNPLAPVFHPGSPASDTPQDFPLPRLLSSLFRLSVACGETPERWGSTRVALISKLKGPDVSPIPSETRPIALLPMFRRLFEILLLPLFDPLTHAWASLNNRQAGFRSGWSCASSILVVDAALATEYPCGGFLDFKSAYDSPSPRLILRSFKKLGMPSYLRRLVWSLLTAGASISVIVNGSESEPFERRRGFPQGSPLSPLLFNLYLDSLLTRLNSIDGVEAWAYADDLVAGAQSRAGMEKALRVAEEWAREWGMRFNPKKCVLMGRSPLWRGQLRGLGLEEEELRVEMETKYLGIERDGQRLRLAVYRQRKVEAMDRFLGGLQAAGGQWPPLIRLTLYRTFCRSLLEYGCPLLHLYLRKLPPKQRRLAALHLEEHHTRAVTWIVGLSNTRAHGNLASAMTGLAPPLLRLEHLALGLACFLEAAPPGNPARLLFLREKLCPRPEKSRHLHTLGHFPLHSLFKAHNQRRIRAQELPLSRTTFLRQDSLRHFQHDSGSLAKYIDPSNRPNGLVDGVLTISCPIRQRLAIRWRANTFHYPLRCFVCEQLFTRRCTSHALEFSPFVSTDGCNMEEELEKINQVVSEINRGRGEGTMWGQSRLRVLDFLLGHRRKEFREVAMATLQAWKVQMVALAELVQSYD